MIDPGRDTLIDVIRDNASIVSEAPAIISSTYEPVSYQELHRQLSTCAVALRGAGLGRESRIGICLSDSPLAALVIVSVSCSAIAVPIDPNLKTAEVEARLKLLELDAVILLAGSASPLREAAACSRIPIIEISSVSERKLGLDFVVPSLHKAVGSSSHVRPDSIAFILQTSGTTAEPKLVPYTHSNLLMAADRVKRWFNLGGSDRCLSITPVHYCHGLTLTVLAPLVSGGSVAFPENPARPNMDEWLFKLAPTWLSAGPTMHLTILEKLSSFQKGVAHYLRFVVSGGAPLPLATQERLEAKLGVPLLDHYGATEAGQIAANLPSPGGARTGTCGVPDPGTVKIVDENGVILPAGEWGEILVGGPTVIAGYLNATELNERAFVDGWYRTGDVGSIDEGGYLTLHGRLNEIINRGGEKISPIEIDVALQRHPEVQEAAAFAMPHPRLGEDVGAAVVLRSGAAATSDEIRQFLSSQLAWYKIPRRIIILRELPKGATGKVQRRKLPQAP